MQKLGSVFGNTASFLDWKARFDLRGGVVGGGRGGEECTDFFFTYTKHKYLKTVTPLTTEHACFKQ